jgi:D-alanyl-D-alanine carboxypeptidase
LKNIISFVTIFFALLNSTNVSSSSVDNIIQTHLDQYAEVEHFSAIQVSVKAGDRVEHHAVGKRSRMPGSENVIASDLFEIGSITKSFTAALTVLADTDGQLKLDGKLRDYLNNYPHWGDIQLADLLNMSTGIPNYSHTPTLNYVFSEDLQRYWSTSDLVALVYPQKNNPPRKHGYLYSNTGYVLMDMILTKLYQKPLSEQLSDTILKPLKLNNTYYPVPNFTKYILDRMVRGYSYNIYDNPELLGEDVTENNLSWAGAAGALVSNSEDVMHWVESLFINDQPFSTSQKSSLQKLVSVTTGEPLERTNEKNPRGFALGLIQAYDKQIGRYWFYEGKTIGFRALYIYVPCNQVIVVALLNSATNAENDHAGDLVNKLYKQLLKENFSLNCRKRI